MNPEVLAEIQQIRNIQVKLGHGERNFIKLVKENQSPGMVVVEVGCFNGSTTINYIDIVKKNKGHVYVIDCFEGTPVPEHMKNNPDILNDGTMACAYDPSTYDNFVENFSRYKDMMTIIKGYSQDCIPNLPENCDIIYLDADHTYSAIKRDIELSIPKVKSGGILSGHDCEHFNEVDTYSDIDLKTDWVRNHHPGVSQAVYEKFGKTDLYGVVWWMRI